MTTETRPRRSFWMFGLESEEPTEQQRREQAKQLSDRVGVAIDAPRIPRVEDIELRDPRIKPPDSIAEF